jgi:hypothetical protein
MLADILAFLVSTFLLGPLQSEVQERLEAARAPQAVMRQVTECGASALPGLVQRAASDPWWAFTTSVGVWIGTTAPEAVLREAGPACGAAMAAARPFLRG